MYIYIYLNTCNKDHWLLLYKQNGGRGMLADSMPHSTQSSLNTDPCHIAPKVPSTKAVDCLADSKPHST